MVCTCHVNLLYYRYTTLFFFAAKASPHVPFDVKQFKQQQESLKLKKILTKQVNNKISVTVKCSKCYMKRKKKQFKDSSSRSYLDRI